MSVSICERCGVGFQRVSSMGPEPKFCSHTCRQRAYEARRDESTKAALAVAKEALARMDDADTDDVDSDNYFLVARDALARIAQIEGA